MYQNDDLGKDFRAGFRSSLGDKADSLIVSEQTFEAVVASRLYRCEGGDLLWQLGDREADRETDGERLDIVEALLTEGFLP